MRPIHLSILTGSRGNAQSIIEPVEAQLAEQMVSFSIATDHNMINESVDIVFVIGYDRIVDAKTIERLHGRIAVFHSSDLPKGRGWAPIYTAILSQEALHTVTLCYARHPVDTGNVLLKAKLPVPAHYNAAMLRAAGRKAIGQLIVSYARRFEGELPPGMAQVGESTYIRRRTPEDAWADVDSPLSGLMPHILASEPPNAAYVIYRGEKFRLQALPERGDLCTNFVVEEYFDAKLDRAVTLCF